MMRSFAALGVILAASMPMPAGDVPASRPAVEVGKDTTVLVRPLKANGVPDYLAAIDDACSKGVTARNNAAVPLIQAVGPDMFSDAVREKTLKKLGIAELKGPFLDAAFKDETELSACKESKTLLAKEHKAVFHWISGNERSLNLVVQAGSRTRFYFPYLTEKAGGLAYEAKIPALNRLLTACEMLLVRAKFAAGEGRVDDARRDILAAIAIGALTEQDPVLITKVVGGVISEKAYMTLTGLAVDLNLSPKTAHAIFVDLQNAPKPPSVTSAVDKFERFGNLEVICELACSEPKKMARTWEELFQSRFGMIGQEPPPAKLTADQTASIERLAAQTTWNRTLRRCNAYFDHMVAHMEGRNDRWIAEKDRPQMPNPPWSTSRPDGAAADFIGDSVLYMLLPDLSKVGVVQRKWRARRDLALVVVALSEYKAGHGKYPETLREIEPGCVKWVPTDVFSTKPLVYHRQVKGYLLYSVGEDGQDNEGDAKKDLVVQAQK